MSKDIIATICQKKQCDNNLSMSAIAKSLNISTTSVRSVLRENDLYEIFSHQTGASSNQSISRYNIIIWKCAFDSFRNHLNIQFN